MQILKRKANINAALLLIVMQVVSMQGSERFRGWFRNGVLNCSEGSYETRITRFELLK
ncbi:MULTISPECIES: hypothetical protein [Cytobacillus]|uniref:hypothetical protein n=1 Tax=Cytobacillus TaxID=2675230 RepID=UPI002117D39B|nr:hypothetical protein [Cytobacillus sp. Bac17]